MRNNTRKKVGLFAFVCIGALVAALAAPAEITSSASGKGELVFMGTRRTFAFNAVKDSFGNARGQGELVRVLLNGGSFTFHLKINCLSIAGNVATMSGTFSDNFGTLFIRGFPFWFRVADNGEGAGSPPDQITLVEFFLPGDGVTCAEDRDLSLIPIDSGNIQVK